MTFDLAPLGDSALTIRVGVGLDEPTRLRVRAAVGALHDVELSGVLDVVPGISTVTLHYDPVAVSWKDLCQRVEAALAGAADKTVDDGHFVKIPVCYGGEFGPDLDAVATHASLSGQEVIDLHAAREYRVHVLGFLPGFAYLGGLDSRLETPRRVTPRDRVPAGSVGIAGMQTGVYPLESPGGWQLLGRSPVALFDPLHVPPTLLAPGDRVRFVAIDRAEFDRLAAAIA